MSRTGTIETAGAPQQAKGGEAATRLHGLLAEFETPHALLAAARKVRDAGFTRWDVHTPYPVHGLDEAVGIRRTILPVLVFCCGLTGAGLGMLMQWWMNAVDYPFIISGKPFWSIPANIPIIFELTILLSAFGAVFGMLALNNLPEHYNPLFRVARFRRATDDRFFISILAADKLFDMNRTRKLLESTGAQAVERVDDSGSSRMPAPLVRGAMIIASLMLIPPTVIALMRNDKSELPRIHPILDMDKQVKYPGKQGGNPIFADGRAMRPQPPGTLARGDLKQDPAYFDGRVNNEWLLTFPPNVTVDEKLLKRGQQRFNIYCAVCHGYDGYGKGRVAVIAEEKGYGWVPPKSVHDADVRARPVGHLYNTISRGIRTMPPYGDQIPVADRWAIVAYVRALQLSQNARLDDVPSDMRSSIQGRPNADR